MRGGRGRENWHVHRHAELGCQGFSPGWVLYIYLELIYLFFKLIFIGVE